jgi:hypothetical protein
MEGGVKRSGRAEARTSSAGGGAQRLVARVPRPVLLWLLSPEYRTWRKIQKRLPTVDEFERLFYDSLEATDEHDEGDST